MSRIVVSDIVDEAALDEHDAALPALEETEETAKPAPVLPPDFPANAKPVGDGSFILHLDYPVTIRRRKSDGSITEEVHKTLHLHRLTGKNQREIRTASEDDIRPQMIASSAHIELGQARLLHDRMDASDIAAVMIVVRFFTTPGRRTGP